MDITNRDRRQLKALAHHLDPVVRVGRNGVTATVTGETERALDAHELIKIRIDAESGKERRDAATRLCEAVGAALVGTVGKIAIVYRPHPEKPVIRLNGGSSR